MDDESKREAYLNCKFVQKVIYNDNIEMSSKKWIQKLISYPNKNANFNAKQQSCNTCNNPKKKIFFIDIPQK